MTLHLVHALGFCLVALSLIHDFHVFLQTCSRGSACNFLHCFRNPGGDYEWADHDKPPPRFWIHKMTALFGYSDEDSNHMEREYSGTSNDLRSDRPTVSHR